MKAARVIGAGLSGLVAAWHLADRGVAVTVIERAPHPGGLIQTRRTEHGLIETGANAFVWDETVAAWFRRLDLTAEFPLRSSRRRFIYRDGRPRRWPLSMVESAGMATRLGGAFLTRATSARRGETMAAWGRRVVGGAATRWLLEPALQGVYAAPLGELSARAIFSGRKRGRRQLAAPPSGMGQFITRLHERLRERGVRFEFNSEIESIAASTPTLICTPAPAAARLVAPHAPRMSDALAAVRMSALTTVTMFFEPADADVHGFGMLFPSRSGVNALGVLYNADIFAGRSRLRAETWIVGDRQQGIAGWDDARLLSALADDRQKVAGRLDRPLSVHVTRWPAAIPVYDEAILGVAAAMPALPEWLCLSGNYLGRIGVAALLEQAAAAASRLARHLDPDH